MPAGTLEMTVPSMLSIVQDNSSGQGSKKIARVNDTSGPVGAGVGSGVGEIVGELVGEVGGLVVGSDVGTAVGEDGLPTSVEYTFILLCPPQIREASFMQG